MYSLLAKSSISMQDCFQKENILDLIEPISFDSELIQPNYKEFLPPAFLRRLSSIIKMGLTTSTDCLSQVNNLPFDAIIVELPSSLRY
jgi:phosphate uptake regulator